MFFSYFVVILVISLFCLFINNGSCTRCSFFYWCSSSRSCKLTWISSCPSYFFPFSCYGTSLFELFFYIIINFQDREVIFDLLRVQQLKFGDELTISHLKEAYFMAKGSELTKHVCLFFIFHIWKIDFIDDWLLFWLLWFASSMQRIIFWYFQCRKTQWSRHFVCQERLLSFFAYTP